MKIEWNKVTWYSWLLTGIIFLLIIPSLTFYFIYQYKNIPSYYPQEYVKPGTKETYPTFQAIFINRDDVIKELKRKFPNSKAPILLPLKVPMLDITKDVSSGENYPVYGTLSYDGDNSYYKITFSNIKDCDETSGEHCGLAYIESGDLYGMIGPEEDMIPVKLSGGVNGYYSLYSCNEGTGRCGGGRLYFSYDNMTEYEFYAPIDNEKGWVNFVNSAIDNAITILPQKNKNSSSLENQLAGTAWHNDATGEKPISDIQDNANATASEEIDFATTTDTDPNHKMYDFREYINFHPGSFGYWKVDGDILTVTDTVTTTDGSTIFILHGKTSIKGNKLTINDDDQGVVTYTKIPDR